MQRLLAVPLICLCTLAVMLPLRADEQASEKAKTGRKSIEKREAAEQENEKPDAAGATPEARLNSLMQQMEQLRRALAEESLAPPAGDPKAMQEKTMAERNMMAEMMNMQPELMRQMQSRRVFYPQPGAFDAAADPAFQALQQAQMMLQGLESAAGAMPAGIGSSEQDPLEIGQKLVLGGLEVQLRALAARINAAQDPDEKQKLTQEFRGVIERLVTDRKKFRERAIEQLEKRLAALKANAEKDETVDRMARRLLQSAPGESQKSADEAPLNGPKKGDAKSGQRTGSVGARCSPASRRTDGDSGTSHRLDPRRLRCRRVADQGIVKTQPARWPGRR